jgi:integrase
MSPVYTKTRTGATGKRYLVYFRRGGRGFPEEYAGSFKTRKEAQVRRDLIAGELAAGRDPKLALEALKTPAVAPAGLETGWDSFIAGRIDVGTSTRNLYRNARDRFLPLLGTDRDPRTILPADIQDAIAGMADLDPASVRQYVSTLAQVLDHLDVEPNPVRSKKVRLPVKEKHEIEPPSTAEWAAARTKLSKKHLLVVRLMECCALRVGEALALTYGDVDWSTSRIRVSRARTKTRSGQRWLPVPEQLLDQVDALVPLEDRHPDRRVFPFEYNAVRSSLASGCTLAGVPYFSPHDLRHRRISLWFAHGVDVVQIRAWSGHANASITSDVYGHVVVDASVDEWRDFWLGSSQRDRATL